MCLLLAVFSNFILKYILHLNCTYLTFNYPMFTFLFNKHLLLYKIPLPNITSIKVLWISLSAEVPSENRRPPKKMTWNFICITLFFYKHHLRQNMTMGLKPFRWKLSGKNYTDKVNDFSITFLIFQCQRLCIKIG